MSIADLKAIAVAHLKVAETALVKVRLTSRRKHDAVSEALDDVRAALNALDDRPRPADPGPGPLDAYFKPSGRKR